MANKILDIVVIGSGFAGIGMACHLKQAGYDFYLFEKSNDIAGVWRDNIYPNACSDIPAKLYSYSFFPKFDWSSSFPPQTEIKEYIESAVKHYDFADRIKFNANVVGLTYITEDNLWHISLENGEDYFSKHVIVAAGMLNRPSVPDIKGIDTFKGKIIHPVNWPKDYEPEGENVAVIGTGSSALQIIPGIADQVKKLSVYQRSAPWIFNKKNRSTPQFEKKLFTKSPALYQTIRKVLHAKYETSIFLMFKGYNHINRFAAWLTLKWMKSQIKDTSLLKKITPTDRLGCKRVGVSGDYLSTLNRSNVNLITEKIKEIVPQGIVTEDGNLQEFDTIITATGYNITEMYKLMNISGIENNLIEEWAKLKAPYAYLGITIRNFPNLYLMNGPNVALAHSSVTYMMEGQMQYILSMLELNKEISENNFLNLKKIKYEKYVQWVKDRVNESVWATGCDSWYLRGGFENISAVWPASTYYYRKLTKRAEASDYEVLEIKKTSA